MALQMPVLVETFTAENDLSTHQFKFVEFGAAARQVDLCDAATDLVVGVLQNKPSAGETAEVMTLGVAKVIASAAIAIGARVGTTNDGRAVTKSVAADLVAGIARTAAGGAGEYVEILLTPGATI